MAVTPGSNRLKAGFANFGRRTAPTTGKLLAFHAARLPIETIGLAL